MWKYILSMFSLDTLDGVDTSTGTTNPYIDYRKDVFSLEKSKKSCPRWKSCEFYIYYWIIFFAVIFSLKTTYDISHSSHRNYRLFSKYLQRGWIAGRRMDNTDIQYAVFRKNILGLVFALVIHLSLGASFDCFSKYFKVLKDNVQRRTLYNIFFSLIFLIVLHGTSVIKIYIIAYLSYCISCIFSNTKLNPALTWFFNIGIVFLNDIYKGYSFGSIYYGLTFLDRYNGLVPRWQIYFNFTMLRLISYNLDFYWSKNSQISEKLTDSQLTEKNRINIPCPDPDYCLRNFFAYVFYAPLYFSGPIISFNNFVSQLRYPSKNISNWWIKKYFLRLLFCFLLMEIMLHFFYVVAISKTKAWDGDSPFQISMIGFFNLQMIWFKLLIIWRFFRFWALCDKIDSPENMIRCINNNYSFLGFWRSWHRSFNRWIIRYIYLPLGGSKLLIVNIFLVFTFVAFWHDISLKLFAWGWLITLFILPEVIFGYIFQSKKWKDRPFYRHLCALGATLNIIMMMIANLVGFCLGIDGTKEIVNRIFINYQSNVVEKDWYKWWQENGFFSKKSILDKSCRNNCVISILPPPNITGTLHLGHALTISIQDALIRWERMRGKHVIWVPGTDHAGIAAQSIVERFLLKTQNLRRKDMTRDAFIDEVWKWKSMHAGHVYHQIASMGASLDWSKEFFTLDSDLSKVVKDCFIRLFNQGLIYRDTKMVNWSCMLETTISDIEVDHKIISKPTKIMIGGEFVEFGVLHQVAYRLVDPSDVNEIVVSTSRLETIPGDKAISVNPNDIRFLGLHGKYCYNPLNPDIIIPIIPDEMVDPNFGTGAVKITPAHDPNDYKFSIRHKIPSLCIFNPDGRMNASCGLQELQYIDRFKCREHILSKLKERGLYRGFQSYRTSIPLCSRSGDFIEYFLKPQWYLKTKPLALNVYDNYKAGKMKIIPEYYSDEWIKWLENIEDWCISRQILWGHRIPAWYVNSNGGYWVAAESEESALKISGGKEVKQDFDVLDTWFSSALLPLSVFRWDGKNVPAEYPLSFIETGSDILFFWILRMTLLCTHFTGKLPFNEIILHPLIKDSQGRKMSKSLGNVIDPLHIIKGTPEVSDNVVNEKVMEKDNGFNVKTVKQGFSGRLNLMGSDSLRFALIDYTKQSRQINMDIANISSAKYICSKLWNATRFFLYQMKHYNLKTVDINLISMYIFDRYIISRLKETIDACNMGFELRKFSEVTDCLRKFIVYDLCSVYIEFIKKELKQNDNKRITCALSTCYSALYTVVKLLHPISPFVTEELYQHLSLFDPYPEASIMISNYPDKNISFHLDKNSLRRVENLVMLVHEFRSMISSAECINNDGLEGAVKINKKNDIFKQDVEEFKNIIQDMIGLKNLTLNNFNGDLPNMYSKVIGPELVLYLCVENLYCDNLKQVSRIKWLQEQEKVLFKISKSEEYIRNAPKHIQEKNIKKMMDIQNELKLLRNCLEKS
ncbi:hypothetical protein PORY_002392 [Pneumocystis oryctolagi]|uniref:Uncharacterized protein n=1 Tax=Pneumocystis oryctolagi TaxID=42067 RepID=A0ACB7C9L2_9ASCO|nr:hypothetical protein PORY_002392 [Pneumocystis oryctolagi]